ncbi:eukaryotic translation initiation factor 4E [Physeter macrocephalus]|uniref:Eukaryotic translation initiation factor 4E n=1 Tax=Physeter macrocephalus TaxID=9755 RepID=A0A2Y9T2P7_PHYMC|nr:eukaryotic translation initiation factor 4E [Physeter catodon]|eukprot:XP_023982359.1 eukaryotic translation initiation factor 4E [Physeter catodon]
MRGENRPLNAGPQRGRATQGKSASAPSPHGRGCPRPYPACAPRGRGPVGPQTPRRREGAAALQTVGRRKRGRRDRGGKRRRAVVRSDRSKMATVEPETTPTPNPPPTEEEKTESNQEVANPEHYIKHPLQNRWALWFFKNDKSKTWQANLRLISKFDTVEDFWALYNHIQLSSNLMPGCDYSLFKDGIEPMWEDEKNKRGGRWLITLNKQQRRSDLDRFWLETLLCLIGESFDDYSDDVCGAVVNVRAKGDKIAIWTTECENREAVTHIGRVYKERLGLPPKIVIGYQSHADTATKSGSTTKNRFVV